MLFIIDFSHSCNNIEINTFDGADDKDSHWLQSLAAVTVVDKKNTERIPTE